MDSKKLVHQFLGEAPVDPQDVGNPGTVEQPKGFQKVYKAVRLEDFEPSPDLKSFLKEASDDDTTYDDGGIDYLSENGPEHLRAELIQLHDAMEAAGATILLLT